MELASRPLLASRLDAPLFVDRVAELTSLERNVENDLNSLVVGPPGIGKTSLLHRLERQLEPGGSQYEAVFVEGSGRVSKPEELLWLITYRLEAGTTRPTVPGDRMQLADWGMPRNETEELLTALRSVREALAARPKRTILIIDELPSGDIAHTLFGQLRDELWSLRATWVVATRSSELSAYLRPPANAFFESTVTLGLLTHDAAVDLLRRRVADADVGDLRLEEIAELVGGNPSALIALARHALLEGRDLVSTLEARDDRTRRAYEIGDSAGRLLSYIEANGPVSASDAQMLAALGWGRARATQVLRRLLEAGLVEADLERTGPGRRKAYRLADRPEGSA